MACARYDSRDGPCRYVPATALAQPSNNDMAGLVRRQANQIECRESRIQTLEQDDDNEHRVIDSRQPPQSGFGVAAPEPASMAGMLPRVASHFRDNVRICFDAIDSPDSSTGYGFELAGLTGPVAASAEYGRCRIDVNGGPDTDYDAYSAQIGYSLTGEPFGYSTKSGKWGRPEIDNPATAGGWGAWQVMARYDALDYDIARAMRAASATALRWA